jgi:hypothetical protein
VRAIPPADGAPANGVRGPGVGVPPPGDVVVAAAAGVLARGGREPAGGAPRGTRPVGDPEVMVGPRRAAFGGAPLTVGRPVGAPGRAGLGAGSSVEGTPGYGPAAAVPGVGRTAGE